MKIQDMMLSAVFAAVMCIFAVISIPVGAVPMSMAMLGIVLTACVLGHKRASASIAVYILIGAVGFPVFSGFRGGLPVIFGPTGGYIIAYIPTAVFIGYFTQKLPQGKVYAVVKLAAVSVVGIAISYAVGTAWFSAITGTAILQSLMICVAPFVVFDIGKCIVGAMLAYTLRKALIKISR